MSLEKHIEAAAQVLSPQVESLGYGRYQFAEAVVNAFLSSLADDPPEEIVEGTSPIEVLGVLSGGGREGPG